LDFFRSNNSGATLLRFEESPSADPHARWCGEGHRRRWPLPDSLQVRHCGNLAKDRSLGVRSFVRVWGELLTQRQCWPFIVEGSCFPRHLRTGIPSFSIFDDLAGNNVAKPQQHLYR